MTRLQAVRLLGAGVAVIAAILFIALAAETISGALKPLDDTIRAGVHGWSSPDMTELALTLSFVGSTPVWLALTFIAVALFWWLGWRHAAADLAIVMAGAALLEITLKLLFARARPEVFFGDLPASHSFPSGHALFAACLYGALACLVEARTPGRASGIALWASAVILIGAIGLSRVYLGVHYPSDVAGGYLVAAGWIGIVTAVRASDRR